MDKVEKNCINCGNFAWWDGDYCCLSKMKILCSSPKGEMNEDILTSMDVNKKCKDWKKAQEFQYKMYKEAFDDFIKKRDETDLV